MLNIENRKDKDFSKFSCLKIRRKELIKRSAYAEELTPAFPSITSPCHTTMATGKHPDKHGVLANTDSIV